MHASVCECVCGLWFAGSHFPTHSQLNALCRPVRVHLKNRIAVAYLAAQEASADNCSVLSPFVRVCLCGCVPVLFLSSCPREFLIIVKHRYLRGVLLLLLLFLFQLMLMSLPSPLALTWADSIGDQRSGLLS